MEYRRLGGNCGLRVSPLCLGTMNFGTVTDEADSWAIMDRALEEGINFFDSANVYGRAFWNPDNPGQVGRTETVMGRWFAQGGGRRDRTTLATKVYGPMPLDEGFDPDRESGLSARRIVLDCEASLARLQTDYIDLYQMHHVDRACPVEEVFEAFDVLKRQGKVRYMGSSNFAGWDIARFNETAKRMGGVGLVSEQSIYSLKVRAIEAEVVPACRAYGVGILPWSPLAGGLLGGMLNKDSSRDAKQGSRRAGSNVNKVLDSCRGSVEKYEAFCSELGEHPANVALAWCLHNPAVSAPIIGPRTMGQFTGCLRAIDLKLDEAALRKLDSIWPGPGGEAPVNYAW